LKSVAGISHRRETRSDYPVTSTVIFDLANQKGRRFSEETAAREKNIRFGRVFSGGQQ
jgi:hypothetical protein